MKALQVGNLLYLVCCWIWAIVILCVQHSFYTHRHHPFLINRRPKSVIWFAGFVVVGIIFDRFPMILFSQTQGCTAPFTHWQAVLSFIAAFLVNGSLWFVVYRLYLVWFDIKWNKALKDAQWRTYVNRNDSNLNWYLRNRSTFGSDKWAAIYSVVWVSIPGVTATVVIFIRDEFNVIGRIIIGISAVSAALHMAVILCRLPTYDDRFFIRKEAQMGSIYAACGIVIYFCLVVIGAPYPPSWQFLFFQCFVSLGYLIPFCISLVWVLHKANLPITPWQVLHYHQEDMMSAAISAENQLSVDVNPNRAFINVDKILQTSDGFRAFALHLCNEFAIENLLFILEIVQFCNHLKQLQKTPNLTLASSSNSSASRSATSRSSTGRRPGVLERVKNLRFPDDAPQSEIVFGQLHKSGSSSSVNSSITPELRIDIMPKYNIYEQTKLLFDKYVCNSADFCINISSVTRQAMYRKMNDVSSTSKLLEDEIGDNFQVLESIFDDCIFEVWKLLQQSHFAFRKTDAYRTWHDSFAVETEQEQ